MALAAVGVGTMMLLRNPEMFERHPPIYRFNGGVEARSDTPRIRPLSGTSAKKEPNNLPASNESPVRDAAIFAGLGAAGVYYFLRK